MRAIVLALLLAGVPDPWLARPLPPPAPAIARPATAPSVAAQRTLVGTASWGWFGGHVVTRLPHGTSIRVCGALGCWSGRSWGYGPAAWTHRIVDLDRSVFAAICGPPSRGLCTVRLVILTGA